MVKRLQAEKEFQERLAERKTILAETHVYDDRSSTDTEDEEARAGDIRTPSLKRDRETQTESFYPIEAHDLLHKYFEGHVLDDEETEIISSAEMVI